MNKEPEITIITPVYNGLPYIKELVDSLLNQEFKNWELLVGDNASDDGTVEYLKSLHDERIRLFLHKKNLGVFRNLNLLFKNATAPYCQILCADDYFEDSKSLTRIVDFWQNAPTEVGFARFDFYPSNEKSNVVNYEREILPDVITPRQADFFFFIFYNIPGNLSNVTVRTQIMNEFGGFKEDWRYSGDFEFWTRISVKYSFALRREKAIYVRKHPGQISSGSSSENKTGIKFAEIREALVPMFNRLVEQFPKSSFLLKLNGTIGYDVLARYLGLRSWLLNGNSTLYHKVIEVNSHAPYLLNQHLRWILFLCTLGGRLFRKSLIKFTIKRFRKSYKLF